MEQQIQHFSHERPLMLSILEDDKISDEKISRCRGCSLRILPGSTFYTCAEKRSCPFSLHKTCAELPGKLEHHHKHPHHTLVLYPQSDYPHICHSCENEVLKQFTYRCGTRGCWFILDVICAFSDHPNEINKIQHRSHPQHSLVLLTKPAGLLCNACGQRELGHFYMCNACGFYIHQDCASFPSTIEHSPHHDVHPLTLSYSLTVDLEDIPWMHDACDICRERRPVFLKYWRYYCRMCRYTVHFKCAFRPKDHFDYERSVVYEDIEKQIKSLNAIRLPPANEFVSVVGHLITSSSAGSKADDMGGSRLEEVPPAAALIEVNHLISHKHPLVLLENHESFLDSFPPDGSSNSLRHVAEYLCDVCFRAVSPPFYCCKICNLFMHEKCSKLPSKIDQHPCHPDHPLFLCPHAPETFNLFTCGVCFQVSNGICFHCSICNFFLDIKCALLPMRIIHDAHPYRVLVLSHHHHQSLPKHIRPRRINCCEDDRLFDFECEYQCVTCDFCLHGHCALFPSTAHDRCDKHPLKLISDPAQGDSDEYYCQICETQINQKCWFYHCFDCDVSFHIRCKPPEDHHPTFHITGFPSLAYHSNLKFGRTSTSTRDHRHPLTVVQHLEGSSCSICRRRIYSFPGLALECSHCKFLIHYWCC